MSAVHPAVGRVDLTSILSGCNVASVTGHPSRGSHDIPLDTPSGGEKSTDKGTRYECCV